MKNYEAQRVLITGGTGTIGKSIISEFRSKGYNVTFSYSKNHKEAKRLERRYSATAIAMDFLDNNWTPPNQHFDVLVNNAGINISQNEIAETTYESWEDTIKVNCSAPFRLIKHYAPKMARRGFGRIINVCSVFGIRTTSRYAPYVASKHALVGLTKVAAREYGKHGITSNAICPGRVRSKMLSEISCKVAKQLGQSEKDYLKNLKSQIPSSRFADPHEIASIISFLASPSASYINGAVLVCDGGLFS